jgi:Helicase associated domain
LTIDFSKLLRYQQRHGHTSVPRSYTQDNNLGRWCGKIKAEERANGKLDAKRVAKLDAMDFDWTLASRLPRAAAAAADHDQHDHHGHTVGESSGPNNIEDSNHDDGDDFEE